MKRCLALIGLILVWPFIFSVTIAAESDPDRGRIKSFMHTFVLEMFRMSPYLRSEATFLSDKGKEVVPQALQNIESKLNSAPPSQLMASPGFRINLSLLKDHISKTKSIYERGEYEYARTRLLSTTGLCASCHTQTPSLSKSSPFGVFADLDNKLSLENAEFLFVIRRYDAALEQYGRLVRESSKLGLTGEDLNEIFRRKLAIIARVKRDPVLGLNLLQEDLKNSSLPPDIKHNIQAWMQALETLKKDLIDPSTKTTAQLLAYVEAHTPKGLTRKIAPSDPQRLTLLYLSGLLYERLYKEPESSETPRILYDLAISERSLSAVDWYSLSEIYLKECIVKYPKQSYAKRCYEAYREGMQERYFGRKVPEGIEESIKALKDYL